MESDLPWVPGAIIALLLADSPFAEASESRLSTRTPSDITRPFATVRMLPALGVMGGGGYKPIIQLDAWSPLDVAEDPEIVVWRIALRGKRIFERARNVPYQTMYYSSRVIDAGPLPPDTSRGASTPLIRAMARAELTIHNQ